MNIAIPGASAGTVEATVKSDFSGTGSAGGSLGSGCTCIEQKDSARLRLKMEFQIFDGVATITQDSSSTKTQHETAAASHPCKSHTVTFATMTVRAVDYAKMANASKADLAQLFDVPLASVTVTEFSGERFSVASICRVKCEELTNPAVNPVDVAESNHTVDSPFMGTVGPTLDPDSDIKDCDP